MSIQAEIPTLVTEKAPQCSISSLRELLKLVIAKAPLAADAPPLEPSKEPNKWRTKQRATANSMRRSKSGQLENSEVPPPPLSLLALWFGPAPFRSHCALRRLTSLLSIAIPDNGEPDSDLDSDAVLSSSKSPSSRHSTASQAPNADPHPLRFSDIYMDIVRTAVQATPTAAQDLGPNAVVLCLASTQTAQCLVALKASPLTKLCDVYKPRCAPQDKPGIHLSFPCLPLPLLSQAVGWI